MHAALPRGLVQVAGLASLEEARAVAAAGATHLGFPLRLPVHAEDVDDAGAARIAAALPAGTRGVVITYLARAGAIAALCDAVGVGIVQLHGAVPVAELVRLRRAAPRLAVIKSLVVRADNLDALQREAADAAPWVDAFLTDTHDPVSGADGATGRAHDWSVSRALARTCGRPLILAGGLHPGNVAAAIDAVAPWGVDAHTGLEDRCGRKDPALVEAFVRAARAAFAQRPPEE